MVFANTAVSLYKVTARGGKAEEEKKDRGGQRQRDK